MAGTVLFQHKELLERARRQIICQRESLYDALLSVQKEFPGKYKLWKPETNFVFIKPEAPEDARRIFRVFTEKSDSDPLYGKLSADYRRFSGRKR